MDTQTPKNQATLFSGGERAGARRRHWLGSHALSEGCGFRVGVGSSTQYCLADGFSSLNPHLTPKELPGPQSPQWVLTLAAGAVGQELRAGVLPGGGGLVGRK